MTATPSKNHEFRQQLVLSKDGTAVSYQSIGTGTPLVVIPGALARAIDYDEFARELAGQFTVHVVNRRGRGESGLQGNDYSVEKECEDLQAVCTATNATLLFGHSYGGFVALETALRDTRFTKIALYEPGLSVDGSIKMEWAPQCQTQLDQGKHSDALVTFIHGLTPASRSLPRWLFRISYGSWSSRKYYNENTLSCIQRFPNTQSWLVSITPILDAMTSPQKSCFLSGKRLSPRVPDSHQTNYRRCSRTLLIFSSRNWII